MPAWGKFEYGENETMPQEMKVWYDWLEEDAEELAHWFKQLGLHRKVVLHDLQRLSQEPSQPTHERNTNTRQPNNKMIMWLQAQKKSVPKEKTIFS